MSGADVVGHCPSGEDDFPLGAYVLIAGKIVGRTEFQDGPPSYFVEYTKKGRPYREWFLASDMEYDMQDGGGI